MEQLLGDVFITKSVGGPTLQQQIEREIQSYRSEPTIPPMIIFWNGGTCMCVIIQISPGWQKCT